MPEEEFGGTPLGDGIDGDPALMRVYAPQGPEVALRPLPSLIQIPGSESVGFVGQDQESVVALLVFLRAANAGIEHLREVARASGDVYLDGDSAARVAIDLTPTPRQMPEPI